MIDSKALLTDLQREVIKLHTDLRARCDAEPAVDAALKAQYDAARAGQRTALTYKAWREEELTNVAVAWVLACVFIRFLEDNGLVETLNLAGPDAAGIGRARDQQIVFFREHPGLSEREYLEHAFTETAKLPGMADLFDRRHNPLWMVGPTGDAARAFIEFWRKADAGTGRPVHDFTDSDWGTRFLGDLYQELSEAARKRYALLQTPVFIEQFILDRTLTPAVETFGFREVRMIDPTCGSGHFLLGGFARLFAFWNEAMPGEVPSVIAQHALNQVFGVDLNPNVVAIARFRLLLAALRVTGTTKLSNAYDFKIHVAAGDALLHGRRFRDFESHTTGPQQTLESIFRDELKHHYEIEDADALHRILGQPYHAVVGNPPYITVKDRAVSELYRLRYPSCSGKYSLAVPFMERFFDLAVKGDGTPQHQAGFIGQITSNSFMKREFGKKLIEEYLPRWDMTHVVDTSGASIPGHSTPTVILFGKNQKPVSSTIRTVLGIRGEPETPEDPAQGHVWQAICAQVDRPGSESEWMSSADSPRVSFHKHPWSIGGGGAAELKELIEEAEEKKMSAVVKLIGVFGMTNCDEVFVGPADFFRRAQLPTPFCRSFITGEQIRDWQIEEADAALLPYTTRGLVGLEALGFFARGLWNFRTVLGNRATFAKLTYFAEGRPWWEWHQIALDRLEPPTTITFPFVATHNQFVIENGAAVFNRQAPIIKLKPNASAEDHASLVGLLNSSLALFWARLVFFPKGGFASGKWEERLEWDGGKLGSFPIPARQPHQLPTALVSYSSAIHDNSPAATLASWGGVESGELRECLSSARNLGASHRRKLIAWQEELDWQIYESFDLVVPADGVSLPEGEGMDMVYEFGLDLGERAFEIMLARRMAAGEVQSTWFERHGSTPITDLPRHWPAPYRELVERRIRRIESDPNIRLIEQPEYKRRWNTESWEGQFTEAAHDWLLARLEGYFYEGQRVCELKDGFAAAGFAPATRPAFTTTNQLAEIAKTDCAFQAVAEQLMGAGFSVPKLVRELVESACVPFLPELRYKPSGLLKREQWEEVWELQRKEDAIDDAEKVDEPGISDAERNRRKAAAAARKKTELGDIPVPPKYVATDFKKPVWWTLRGKLDVPKERWIYYPGTERTEDPSPVIAWAGWDHAQQARALAEYYVDAKQTYGFPPEKLTLLLAGLQDLQPWLDQWHYEIDPTYGVSPAEAIRGFLDAESQTNGLTREDLEKVRIGT
ncbi:MAG: BREX-2 system adenine-specific DNA-methyltransferase PglX [Chthoniobacter sp.]|nr:BREX-2 system adenine-specific DNA-methyltransferase PglX [Chthoniobacter sp.]